MKLLPLDWPEIIELAASWLAQKETTSGWTSGAEDRSSRPHCLLCPSWFAERENDSRGCIHRHVPPADGPVGIRDESLCET